MTVLKIKLDKSHNALGHAAQLCRNDEYHVTAKAPHVFSVTAVVKIIWLLVHCFSNPSYSHIRQFTLLFSFLCLNVRIKDVSLWITRIAIIYSKATSSRFIAPSHFPLVHSKCTRAECLHARISSFQPILTIQGFGHFSFLCLSLMSLPPHPWPFFHPSLNSVKGLLSIPALSFEAVLKVEWQMLRVEVYFGEEQRWPN